jgi:hypothetical protein
MCMDMQQDPEGLGYDKTSTLTRIQNDDEGGKGDAPTATIRIGNGDGHILSIHPACLPLRCANAPPLVRPSSPILTHTGGPMTTKSARRHDPLTAAMATKTEETERA